MVSTTLLPELPRASCSRKPHKGRYEAEPLYRRSSAVLMRPWNKSPIVSLARGPDHRGLGAQDLSISKRLIVRGAGFSTDGTELWLRPTSRSSYEVESVEMAEMVLILKEGKSWRCQDEGRRQARVHLRQEDRHGRGRGRHG